MPWNAGARLPTNRRTTSRAARSCSVHPAGRFGLTDGDGSTDGATDADAATDGATVAAPGVGGAPKLHCGVAAAWQAATLAATPARPVRPAARRNPRRVRGDDAMPGSSVTDEVGPSDG